MNKILSNIKEDVSSIEYRTQLIGRNQRLTNALENTRIKGFLLGVVCTLLVILLPILIYNGGL